MPRFTVARSTTIDASAADVFETLRDFETWPSWSPWLVAEPGCPLEFASDGKSYSWDGEIIGSGSITVAGETAGHEILLELTILKPWKSRSDVSFRLMEKEGGTRVTWEMVGSLPFFLFPMKAMMTALIGMDYEHGLKKLKDFCETGDVPSKVAFPGVREVGAFRYVGVSTECPIAQIGARMEADFSRLRALGLKASGPPFTSYSKWNLGKGLAGYTCGIPVGALPTDLPEGFVTGEHPACRAYAVEHTGPYRHLAGAWSSGMAHARAKRFRQGRKVKPFEIYENSPEDTGENDLVTVVYFPVK